MSLNDETSNTFINIDSVYSIKDIYDAFRKTFYKSGEIFFPYEYTEEENEKYFKYGWDEFYGNLITKEN